jgi:tRNA1Val (adenine37-N6)-methyltransferase
MKFTFKKFEISQKQTAMKVCTDACLFGAIVEVDDSMNKILDIGTGTGLLALMLAQRASSAQITAVEIEKEAAEEATCNVSQSIFNQQIEVKSQSIQSFAENKVAVFDLIISNPPFFKNHLKSADEKKNKALHNDSLSFEEICTLSYTLLKSDGSLWILLPPFEMGRFEHLALKSGFKTSKMTHLRHRPSKAIFRQIAHFTKKTPANGTVFDEVCIYEKDNTTYSQRFVSLLKNYYLIF